MKIAAWILLTCSIVCFAQLSAFEVASIRPATGSTAELARARRIFVRIDNSTVSLGAFSLFSAIGMAFRIPSDQIVAPDWVRPLRFDIQAKIPTGTSKEKVPEMLQSLLADRFGLIFHREQRTMQVYELKIGLGGHRLRDALAAATESACNGGFRKICRQVTMEDFAALLTRFSHTPEVPGAVDRPVVDMTELKGKYDFDFDSGRVETAGGQLGAEQPEVVSAFDAVKALGLRLEPATHTFEYIVVDHLERAPTEN